MRPSTSTTTTKPPKRRSRPSSPPRAAAVSVIDDVTNDVGAEFSYYNNPRSFPHSVKKQCWEKAEKIKGRDPDRWRRDYLGNTVFRKLVGCSGCLCHDYDHIVPYSKGGESTLDNCQVLQAKVNRSKGNRTEFSRAELIQKSSYCQVSGRDMDLLELSAYGNVRPAQEDSYCRVPGRDIDLIGLAKGNFHHAQESRGCTIQ